MFICGYLAMPELPEVETTCRSLRPHLEGARIATQTLWGKKAAA